MLTNICKAYAVVLLAWLGATRAPAATITIDLPELLGTFVHGQAPVVADVDFGLDFQPLWSMTLAITATGHPGHIGAVALPVDLLVSAQGEGHPGAPGMTWLPPTSLGPYGQVSTTRQVQEYYVWVAIYPPPVTSGRGTVTIDTPPGVIDDDFPSYLEITSARLTAEYTPALGGCGVDVNCDGFVGIMELNLVLGNWNQAVPVGDMLSGDASGDGYVGIEDLSAVLGNWNAGTPPAAAVPEPGTITVVGLISTYLLRRRP